MSPPIDQLSESKQQEYIQSVQNIYHRIRQRQKSQDEDQNFMQNQTRPFDENRENKEN
jgi:hypothetical protein